MGMTLQDRADAYMRRFPNYPGMLVDKGWLIGVWLLGQLFQRPDRTLYGGYPGNYLKRLLTLFPDMSTQRTLHVFAGHTPKAVGGIRVDLVADRRPDVVADANALPFCADTFDLIIADPPYSANDAEKYGTPMITRRVVMHHLRSVISPRGMLCWLDTVRPMYRRDDWQQVGAIAVLVSTNTRTRLLSIFRPATTGGTESTNNDEPMFRFDD